MKMLSLFLVVTLFTSKACNAYSQVTGTIKELYVHEFGQLALTLNEGFPQHAIAECARYNGNAGSRSLSPFLKSLLLAAYISKTKVKIGVAGCDDNWLRIRDIRLIQ